VLHLIDREYAELIDPALGTAEKVVLLAREFRHRLSALVANWMRVGYCQGNFNSDNCAAGGFTLDYGPFGFIDAFNPTTSHGPGAGSTSPSGINRCLGPLQSDMLRLISIEEGTLFPNAMGLLEEREWQQMREGDAEIGWMFAEAPVMFPPQSPEQSDVAADDYIHPSQLTEPSTLPDITAQMAHYDEGYMTPEQVNLLFKVLPLDITYVDENDRVIFYNRGEERTFPRSKNIIGREVRFCHPPKSVDTVLKILEEFKKGSQNVADFRIHVKGRYILIRYFAVRDADGTYRGVVEMSQDITDIQTLEGEQRLLDWE
jgi:PAS domain S-box-containing protein